MQNLWTKGTCESGTQSGDEVRVFFGHKAFHRRGTLVAGGPLCENGSYDAWISYIDRNSGADVDPSHITPDTLWIPMMKVEVTINADGTETTRRFTAVTSFCPADASVLNPANVAVGQRYDNVSALRRAIRE